MKPWTSFEHLICMSNYCTSYSQNAASLLLTLNTLSTGKGVLERYFVKRFYQKCWKIHWKKLTMEYFKVNLKLQMHLRTSISLLYCFVLLIQNKYCTKIEIEKTVHLVTCTEERLNGEISSFLQ